MDSFDLSEQRIVQLEQIPDEIRRQIERGDGVEYALDLSLNQLHSIDQIGVFDHVSQLDLSGNQLENVNGIQALRRLQSLDLSRNCIISIDLLALLPALQILKVAENSLMTIDSLQLLPQLQVVDASYNRIAKWPPVANLSLLETLDLSDNMLGAFSSSLSTTLFPSGLRRLSIARNQIDQLCGVACLGLQLPGLEFLAFDENPIVLEMARSGGQLERLLAMFFPRVPLSNDGGLTLSGRRHEEFSTSSQNFHALKRAILEGQEDVLDEFLVTGSMTSQAFVTGVASINPPPAPVERPLPNRQQLPLLEVSKDQNVGDITLSHDNKLEIWKRIQENRKAQFNRSSGLIPVSNEVKKEKLVRWGEHSVVSALEEDVRKPALTTADLFGPEQSPLIMSALDASSRSVMKPLNSTFPASIEPSKNSLSLNGAEYDALVKKLTDQVTTMRKYMKVWIKREKMVRDASARKLQRWFRRLQRKFQLRHRILHSRSRRQDEYSFCHCSSTVIPNFNYRGVAQARLEAVSAQKIQSFVRGYIIRRRIIRFKQKHKAAYKIQIAWREIRLDRQAFLKDKWILRRSTISNNQQVNGLFRGIIQCLRDVKQLQQVCAVQDDAIRYLWDNQSGNGPVHKTNIEKNVAHCQLSHDKPGKDDHVLEMYPASIVNEMKAQMDRQSLEIDQMKQQLQSLQNLIASKFGDVN